MLLLAVWEIDAGVTANVLKRESCVQDIYVLASDDNSFSNDSGIMNPDL